MACLSQHYSWSCLCSLCHWCLCCVFVFDFCVSLFFLCSFHPLAFFAWFKISDWLIETAKTAAGSDKFPQSVTAAGRRGCCYATATLETSCWRTRCDKKSSRTNARRTCLMNGAITDDTRSWLPTAVGKNLIFSMLSRVNKFAWLIDFITPRPSPAARSTGSYYARLCKQNRRIFYKWSRQAYQQQKRSSDFKTFIVFYCIFNLCPVFAR